MITGEYIEGDAGECEQQYTGGKGAGGEEEEDERQTYLDELWPREE